MTDREHVERWLDDYVAAWKSYDRDEIAALFSRRRRVPLPPVRRADPRPRGGRRVVARRGDHDDARTATSPAPTTRAIAPVAVDGDVAVATGTSTYTNEPGGPVDTVYDNCFVIRFDDDGRCREFTEWFVKRPERRRVASRRHA